MADVVVGVFGDREERIVSGENVPKRPFPVKVSGMGLPDIRLQEISLFALSVWMCTLAVLTVRELCFMETALKLCNLRLNYPNSFQH